MIINTNKTKTEDALILQEKNICITDTANLVRNNHEKKMDCLKPRVKDCKSLIFKIKP